MNANPGLEGPRILLVMVIVIAVTVVAFKLHDNSSVPREPINVAKPLTDRIIDSDWLYRGTLQTYQQEQKEVDKITNPAALQHIVAEANRERTYWEKQNKDAKPFLQLEQKWARQLAQSVLTALRSDKEQFYSARHNARFSRIELAEGALKSLGEAQIIAPRLKQQLEKAVNKERAREHKSLAFLFE